jgi:hypothetical protein
MSYQPATFDRRIHVRDGRSREWFLDKHDHLRPPTDLFFLSFGEICYFPVSA